MTNPEEEGIELSMIDASFCCLTHANSDSARRRIPNILESCEKYITLKDYLSGCT